MNHKNIMKFYEIHESENSLYIVLELVNGGDLLKLISNN